MNGGWHPEESVAEMPNHGQVRGADSLEKMKKLEVTMTSGRGQFSMEFSHYAPCPKNVSDDVIAKAKAREEALRK